MSSTSSVVTSTEDINEKPSRPNTFIEIMDGYQTDSTATDDELPTFKLSVAAVKDLTPI